MAFWQGSRYATKKIDVNLSEGLNQTVSPLKLSDGELYDCSNVNSRYYPSLSTIPIFRQLLVGINAPSSNETKSSKGIRGTDTIYNIVTDNKWFKINNFVSSVQIGTLLPDKGSLFNFNNGSNNYSIYYSTNDIRYTDNEGVVSTTTLSISSTDVPKARIAASHKNRIFSSIGNTVYYCALSDFTDWTTANNAGSFNVPSNIPVTNMISFKDKLVIFTEFEVYELYGDNPTAPNIFNLIKIKDGIGCDTDINLVASRDFLFFANSVGVYKYDGSSITKISQKIQTYWDNMRNFSNGTGANLVTTYAAFNLDSYFISRPNLFFSVESNTYISRRIVLEYNTKTDTWFSHDFSVFTFGDDNTPTGFIGNSTYLLVLDSNAGIYEFNNLDINPTDNLATSNLTWQITTKMFNEGVNENQSLRQIRMLCEGSSETDVSVFYSTHLNTYPDIFTDSTTYSFSTSFKEIPSTFSFQSLSTAPFKNMTLVDGLIRLPSTILGNDKYYKLKFKGNGPFKLHKLEKWYRIRK